MKLSRLSSRIARRGSILLVAVVVMALVGIALAFSLQRVQNQNVFSARTQAWNWSVARAEAGIEEAIAHTRYNYSNLLSQGWTLTNGLYVQQRQFGSDFFRASIATNASPGPKFTNRVTSAGCVYFPSTGTFICRTVAVEVVRTEFSPCALVARKGVSMKGNPAGIDSYDSSDPAKSTAGAYDPAKRQAGAQVGCVNGKFDLGNGDIWGKMVSGPGVMSISTGPNCIVGNLAWHAGGSKGVQPGASIIDSGLAAPDNVAPFASAPLPPALTIGTTVYAAVLDNGNYMVTGNLMGKVLVRGKAQLYVTGNVSVTGQGFIQFAPGAALRLSVGGANANIQDVRMTPNTGTFFGIYGLPSVKNVTVPTAPGAPVYVNAPDANFSLGGSGDFYGAVVCDSFSSAGNPGFHFDEALGKAAAKPQFDILAWTEQ